MNKRASQFVSVASSFAVGFMAGLLLAPASGRKTRHQIWSQARRQLDIAEKKLHEVEERLSQISERVDGVRNEWGEKLRKAAKETVEQHVPDLSMPEKKWDLNDDEMKRELRHIAR